MFSFEEAGEIVLAGKETETCPDCEGRGWVYAEPIVGGLAYEVNGQIAAVKFCRQCDQKGCLPTSRYISACAMIGVSHEWTPPRPYPPEVGRFVTTPASQSPDPPGMVRVMLHSHSQLGLFHYGIK